MVNESGWEEEASHEAVVLAPVRDGGVWTERWRIRGGKRPIYKSPVALWKNKQTNWIHRLSAHYEKNINHKKVSRP